MAKVWGVSLPIAGHLYLEVVADNEESAIEKAFDVATVDDLETWEALRQFNEGNVCYCPHPWEAEARDMGDADEEPSNG